jgi:hypothetical protein
MLVMSTVQYIVYTLETPRKVSGLLGALDIYCIQLLLIGGRTGIEESVNAKDPVAYYTTILEEQGMVVKSSHLETLKAIKRVWIEIDSEQTPIHEYTSWKDVEEKDTETLAWKPFWIPCLEGSRTESLGLSVVARETAVFRGKHKVTLQDIFSTLLSALKDQQVP